MHFFGSEIPFPFEVVTSNLTINGLNEADNKTIKDLEDKSIPCRLASLKEFAGCYRGYVTELANSWLSNLCESEKNKIVIYACGPELMLEAVSGLARKHQIDCQLSLEEFMACAIGGCAGCTVKVSSSKDVAMKRVCVLMGLCLMLKASIPNERYRRKLSKSSVRYSRVTR